MARWNGDESYILTGSGDGSAQVWQAAMDGLVKTLCRYIPRNMTLDEWQQFFGDQPYRPTCSDLAIPISGG